MIPDYIKTEAETECDTCGGSAHYEALTVVVCDHCSEVEHRCTCAEEEA